MFQPERPREVNASRTPGIRIARRALWVALLAVAAALGAAGSGDAAFPGANGKIAFASSRTGGFEIFTMKPDGSDQQNLSMSNSVDVNNLDPAWSADGAKIAFTSDREGFDTIWVMNADGSGQTRLTTDIDRNPAWSPDGQKIAFDNRFRANSWEIYVVNSNGGVLDDGLTRLTFDGENHEPAWSPDGQKIAFAHAPETEAQGIYVMNADGSGRTRVTSDGARLPSWSPDGQKIAYQTGGFYGEIRVVDADGAGQPVTLTNRGREPKWSPDGQKIVFESDRDLGFGEIYVMNADGSGQTRLTTNAADTDKNIQPDWQPAGGKAGQSIIVATSAPATAAYNTSFTVAATASSGLPVSYSSAGVCTNIGATFTITSGTGTCTVRYDQAGDSNYDPAPQVTESVTAQKASQSITFPVVPDKAIGAPDFDPGATASSGLAVSYTASGTCSIVAGLVHLNGVGTCTVTASQPGDANYAPALSVSRTFTIATPLPIVGSFSPASGKAGVLVTIHGQNFDGATAVVFGGGKKSAKFAVVSSTLVNATVPSGAKSGPISVTTPAGTGVSTASFTVLKK